MQEGGGWRRRIIKDWGGTSGIGEETPPLQINVENDRYVILFLLYTDYVGIQTEVHNFAQVPLLISCANNSQGKLHLSYLFCCLLTRIQAPKLIPN